VPCSLVACGASMCSKRSLATPSVSSGEERERSNGGYGSVPGSNLSPRYTSSDHSCSQEPSHSLPVLSCWVFMAQGLAESGRMTARVADIIFKSWWTSKWAKQLDIEECSKAETTENSPLTGTKQKRSTKVPGDGQGFSHNFDMKKGPFFPCQVRNGENRCNTTLK